MRIIRLISILAIFGLFVFFTKVDGQEDPIEADVEVDEEEEPVARPEETITPANDILEGKDDDDPNRIQSSPDFHTVYIFIQPAKADELIAGKLTRLLIGTRNNGKENFIIESIDGSLRYPQDYSYYIQNFTSLRTEKVLEPSLESTFEYLFMPHETFNGRPMGLVVLINYRNNEGKNFQNVVFNQTINLTEIDEGFDAETFFLYIFLGAILVLLGFVAYQYLLSNRVKRATSKQASQIFLSNQKGKGAYDPDWIPKGHLIQSRSPKPTTRQRKAYQTNNNVNDTNEAIAASSENDE